MTHHWDELSKSLAEKSVPRRESLRLLGAAMIGAFLSPLGVRTAWAGRPDLCKSFCNQCPKSRRSNCLANCRACNNDPSRLCGNCWSGFACCATSEACCSGHCSDLADDFDNCGACGAPCEYPGPYEDGACVDGQCFYSCVPGAVDCGDGACTALWSDPNNCGACGNVCPDWAQRCTDGVCDPCIWPFILCGEVCVDPTSDRNNCGGCGIQCGDTEACMFGFCESGG